MVAVAAVSKVRRILGDFNAWIALIERYRNTLISVIGDNLVLFLVSGCMIEFLWVSKIFNVGIGCV